jgi:hypothetical protein
MKDGFGSLFLVGFQAKLLNEMNALSDSILLMPLLSPKALAFPAGLGWGRRRIHGEPDIGGKPKKLCTSVLYPSILADTASEKSKCREV